jgi:hypothetical protein
MIRWLHNCDRSAPALLGDLADYRVVGSWGGQGADTEEFSGTPMTAS